jgi:hypothetical protein
VENTLPAKYFFRINRQYILHRQSIAGFERIENGKLHLMVKPMDTQPSIIVISLLRAPAFKEWFQPAYDQACFLFYTSTPYLLHFTATHCCKAF